MSALSCARCGRKLAEGEVRRVPGAVVWGAATACAFFHGGLWAREQLTRPYCARCRALLVPGIVLAAVGIFAVAAAGAIVWLRGTR